MPSTPIHAIDERLLPFPPEPIWDVLADLPASPGWWPPSVRLKVLRVTPQLVGTEMQVHPRGGRPFLCQVESLEPPRRMRLRYGGSFVTGWGEWRLEPAPGGTRVYYELNVTAAGWLVALLGRCLSLPRLHSRAMHDVLRQLESETARRGGRRHSD